MTKAYVIIAGSGEYSDRCTWPVRIYLNKERAEQEMAKLDALYNKYDGLKRKARDSKLPHGETYAMWCDYDKAAREEYEALGYEGFDSEDWGLSEADLFE